MRSRTVAAALGVIVAILLWGEWVNSRANARRLGTPQRERTTEAVVVLGFRNRGYGANYLNRDRVRAGLRSIDPAATQSVLVFCGGGVASSVPEAELMARYARETLGYGGPIRVDPHSTTTWQNIENAIALITEFDAIKIVSNSLHAEKGREYLWRQRPDLAERLARANDYRFGEILFVKPIAAVVGLRDLWSLDRRRGQGD